MIQLTKLDGHNAYVSLDAIKYVETIPDTLITFLNGESLLVKEDMETFLQRVQEFRLKTLTALPAPAEQSSNAAHVEVV
ncbi:MAG: flagellar FlbD family protein [Zetaproteobacteria bacterium]|nr:flagellar FlbD family protein [Zetaproteobacteria bacterium]